MDTKTTVNELREMVQKFVHERDWEQFHSPKNLVMALAVETSELMEHFQWMTTDESRELGKNPDSRQKVEEELPDVACYVIALANAMSIDISRAIEKKMEKNREKYPAKEFRGRFRRD